MLSFELAIAPIFLIFSGIYIYVRFFKDYPDDTKRYTAGCLSGIALHWLICLSGVAVLMLALTVAREFSEDHMSLILFLIIGLPTFAIVEALLSKRKNIAAEDGWVYALICAVSFGGAAAVIPTECGWATGVFAIPGALMLVYAFDEKNGRTPHDPPFQP